MPQLPPIDAVLAWVDGSDPKHFEKKNISLKKLNKKYSENYDASRYSSNYEINYAVLSILKFAPFVRNIFIVTDGQNPPISEDVKRYDPKALHKIIIVDHREIFKGFEQYLPSFNSRSIATAIYRIPELAERFIYFNDDFFLIKPCVLSDFFNDQRPILRGNWEISSEYRYWWYLIKNSFYSFFNFKREARASFHLSQWFAAKQAGFRFRFWTNYHTPHPINKLLVENYFQANPEVFINNIKHQFRSVEQFSAISLFNHLEKSNGNPNEGTDKEVYLKKRKKTNYIKDKITYLESNSCKEKFLCIQNFDKLTMYEREELYNYLDHQIAKVNRNE